MLYTEFFAESEEEHNENNRRLHERVAAGEILEAPARYFFCHCLPFRKRAEYPICFDEYFVSCYLARHSNGSIFYTLEERDHLLYESIVWEWESIVRKTNQTDSLIDASALETRKELKQLATQFSVFRPQYASSTYLENKFSVLEWSRYRYVTVKDIFDLSIKNTVFRLSLNELLILFDQLSLTHILTRHFGSTRKRYFNHKSHFTKDISHEEIHTKLSEIFQLIDGSLLYVKDNITDLNFEFKKLTYKVYIEEKLLKAKKTYRIATFFPIEETRMLAQLEQLYEKKFINDELSIFTKIRK